MVFTPPFKAMLADAVPDSVASPPTVTVALASLVMGVIFIDVVAAATVPV